MTKFEINTIKKTQKIILADGCDEIRSAYKKIHGDLVGIEDFILEELKDIWTNHEPYLDKHYLDLESFDYGKKIINLDDIWCLIRDGLKYDYLKSGLAKSN